MWIYTKFFYYFPLISTYEEIVLHFQDFRQSAKNGINNSRKKVWKNLTVIITAQKEPKYYKLWTIFIHRFGEILRYIWLLVLELHQTNY